MARGDETTEALLAKLQTTTADEHTPVASVTALAAITADARSDGMICLVQSDVGGAASLWQFSAASSATDASSNVVVTPSAGSGRWLRLPGAMALSLACTKDTADAAVLWTCPTGARFRVLEAWWEVGTSFSGGSSSAIGVHCSVSGWSTKGDILGGASGDLAATLVSTNARMVGTVGAKLDAHTHDRLIMIAADTLNFDQIVSQFTAGAGNVRVSGILLSNPGA